MLGIGSHPDLLVYGEIPASYRNIGTFDNLFKELI